MNVVCQYATSLSLLLSLIFILNRNTGQRCTKCPCWEHILCHLVPREESNAAEVWGARRPATLSAHPQAQARKMCWHKKKQRGWTSQHPEATGISLEYQSIWKWCRIHMDPHGSTDISVKSRHIPPESTPSFVVGRKTLKGKGLKRLPGTSKCLTVFDTPKIALISSASADKISDSACAWTMLEHIVRYWYIYIYILMIL